MVTVVFPCGIWCFQAIGGTSWKGRVFWHWCSVLLEPMNEQGARCWHLLHCVSAPVGVLLLSAIPTYLSLLFHVSLWLQEDLLFYQVHPACPCPQIPFITVHGLYKSPPAHWCPQWPPPRLFVRWSEQYELTCSAYSSTVLLSLWEDVEMASQAFQCKGAADWGHC